MSKKKTIRKRSPTYPIIGLQEAINKVSDLYNKEKRNSVPREIAVQAMGYNSLSGRSLQILSSLFQYDLLERSKGTVKITDDAFTILNAPEGSIDKNQALKRAALAPDVFQDIINQYPRNLPSDENIKWFLQQKDFSAQAANATIQSFRETISFANVYEKGYNTGDEQTIIEQDLQESPMNANTQNTAKMGLGAIKWAFPFGEKTISLLIDGGNPDQEEMQSLIDILTAVKKTLPQKKKEEKK
jgi:hypothetical protein